jgi:hypothetical protein
MLCQSQGSNIVLFNLDYLISAAMSGIPGSGHPYTPLMNCVIEFDEQSNEWRVWKSDRPDRVYRFALPDAELSRIFKENRQYIPRYEMLQKKTDKEIGYCIADGLI